MNKNHGCRVYGILNDDQWKTKIDYMRRVYDIDFISLTIATVTGGGMEVKVAEPQILDAEKPMVGELDIRIRKLTPRECFRLMDFDDEDFNKAKSVNSNTQLYKQAGNSIVVSVLMAIFSQMGIEGVPIWNDLSNEERRKLLKK